MEHRLCTRFPLRMPIEIMRGRGGESSGKFMSHDISHGGVFISGCDLPFKPGNFVYVKLTTNFTGVPREYLMKAMVVHRSDNGVGFMWTTSNKNFHKELEMVRNQAMAS